MLERINDRIKTYFEHKFKNFARILGVIASIS